MPNIVPQAGQPLAAEFNDAPYYRQQTFVRARQAVAPEVVDLDADGFLFERLNVNGHDDGGEFDLDDERPEPVYRGAGNYGVPALAGPPAPQTLALAPGDWLVTGTDGKPAKLTDVEFTERYEGMPGEDDYFALRTPVVRAFRLQGEAGEAVGDSLLLKADGTTERVAYEDFQRSYCRSTENGELICSANTQLMYQADKLLAFRDDENTARHLADLQIIRERLMSVVIPDTGRRPNEQEARMFDIRFNRRDVQDVLTDEQALIEAQRPRLAPPEVANGARLAAIPENVPAIIGAAMIRPEHEAGAQPLNWMPLRRVPSYSTGPAANMIRSLSREIFGRYGETRIEDIMMTIANDARAVADWAARDGQRLDDGTPFRHPDLGDYTADVRVYEAGMVRVVSVQDFAGHVVYAFPNPEYAPRMAALPAPEEARIAALPAPEEDDTGPRM